MAFTSKPPLTARSSEAANLYVFDNDSYNFMPMISSFGVAPQGPPSLNGSSLASGIYSKYVPAIFGSPFFGTQNCFDGFNSSWPLSPSYQGCQFRSPPSLMTQSFGGIPSSVYNFPTADMSCSSASGWASTMFYSTVAFWHTDKDVLWLCQPYPHRY